MDFNRFGVSYEEFRAQFEKIDVPRDAALIATIYCGYARVGEIVRGRYDKSPSILKQHFEFTPTHLILTIKTEKTGQWRRVATSREKEDWLHEPIRNYLAFVGTEEVFPITTAWAEKIFRRHFGTWHIHLLRHWACTHALQGKRTKSRLGLQNIARLGGWITLDTVYGTYSHFVVEDFIGEI